MTAHRAVPADVAERVGTGRLGQAAPAGVFLASA